MNASNPNRMRWDISDESYLRSVETAKKNDKYFYNRCELLDIFPKTDLEGEICLGKSICSPVLYEDPSMSKAPYAHFRMTESGFLRMDFNGVNEYMTDAELDACGSKSTAEKFVKKHRSENSSMTEKTIAEFIGKGDLVFFNFNRTRMPGSACASYMRTIFRYNGYSAWILISFFPIYLGREIKYKLLSENGNSEIRHPVGGKT